MEINRKMMAVMPEFIRKNFGEENFQLWLKKIPKTAADLYSYGKFESEWYDSDDYFVKPSLKMCEMFYDGDISGCREYSKYDTKKWFSGLTGLFVRIMPISFLADKFLIPNLHSHYRIVDVKTIKHDKGHWVYSILGLDGTQGAAAEHFAGVIEVLLEMKNKKDIKVCVETSRKKHKLYTMYEVMYKD